MSEKMEEIAVLGVGKRANEKREETKRSRRRFEPLEIGYHALLSVYKDDSLPAFFGPEAIPEGKDMEVIQILRTLKQKGRLLFALALEDLPIQ